MAAPRYEVKLIDHQGGRKIVHVFDSIEGKVHMVYRRGSRYLHWNRGDLRVENRGLQRVVRLALEGGV